MLEAIESPAGADQRSARVDPGFHQPIVQHRAPGGGVDLVLQGQQRPQLVERHERDVPGDICIVPAHLCENLPGQSDLAAHEHPGDELEVLAPAQKLVQPQVGEAGLAKQHALHVGRDFLECDEMSERVAVDEEGVALPRGGERKRRQLRVKVELLRQSLSGLLLETDEIRERADEAFVALEHRHLPLEHGRAPQVIGVEESQVLARGEVDAFVARRRSAPVRLLDVADPGIAVRRDDGAGIVAGAVVDDQYLGGRVRLREHRVDALGDVFEAIVARYDDRDAGIVHGVGKCPWQGVFILCGAMPARRAPPLIDGRVIRASRFAATATLAPIRRDCRLYVGGH